MTTFVGLHKETSYYKLNLWSSFLFSSGTDYSCGDPDGYRPFRCCQQRSYCTHAHNWSPRIVSQCMPNIVHVILKMQVIDSILSPSSIAASSPILQFFLLLFWAPSLSSCFSILSFLLWWSASSSSTLGTDSTVPKNKWTRKLPSDWSSVLQVSCSSLVWPGSLVH